MMLRRVRYLIPLLVITCVCVATADKAPDNLRVLETEHYRIHSDLDFNMTADLARRMEAMYGEYARRLSDFTPATDGVKFDAYLFARRIDYMKLSGDRFPNTGGLFLPSRNLLAVFLENQGPDGIRRTLQHEAFHQFAYTGINGDLPVWLNEGIAQVFEEGIWTGQHFLIGQVPPHRVAALAEQIKSNQLIDFKTFLQMSNQQWSSNLRDKTQATRQYNQAWAMAQFLIYASDEHGTPRFRPNLLDMLRMIHGGTDPQTAFTRAFSDNYSGFQKMFIDWARTLSPTAAATYEEHQTMLADMLIGLGNRGLQFNDVDTFRKSLTDGGYRLRTSNGEADLLPSIFFCDLTGNPLSSTQLYFAPSVNAPAPDIICRPTPNLQLRTHFLKTGETMNYETLVESN